MRRGLHIAALIAGVLGAHEAAAKDMGGRFGIGGAQTLGGVRGLDVMYWAGKLALNGTVSFLFASPDGGNSGLAVNLAAGVLFPLLGGDHADLSIGGRFDIAAAKDRDPEFAIEAPLRIEWYASENLSLHAEVGVALDLVGDRGRLLAGAGSAFAGSGGGTGFTIGGTYVTAGGGFTVYF